MDNRVEAINCILQARVIARRGKRSRISSGDSNTRSRRQREDRDSN